MFSTSMFAGCQVVESTAIMFHTAETGGLCWPAQFVSPWSRNKAGDCWRPKRRAGCARMFPRARLDNSEFSEHQRREQTRVTERIIGHECASLSRQAAGSWRAPLMRRRSIPGPWVKKNKMGQLAKNVVYLHISTSFKRSVAK